MLTMLIFNRILQNFTAHLQHLRDKLQKLYIYVEGHAFAAKRAPTCHNSTRHQYWSVTCLAVGSEPTPVSVLLAGHQLKISHLMAGGGEAGVDLSRKFVSEAELDKRRQQRQEEWEKVRKPDDPEEAPEETYDPRSLFERLQEQKDKKQEEFEEQFKFKNMVRGLDQDESNFLDEVSRQQCLLEKQTRDEEMQELLEYRSALMKQASTGSHKETEKKAAVKHVAAEQKTSHRSQAHLLAGAVKRRSSSLSSEHSKKQILDVTTAETMTANEGAPGGECNVQQDGGGERGHEDDDPQTAATQTRSFSALLHSGPGGLHLPSAAVCVGVLPGLCVYSSSSDSDSSSDSEV
ncbi:PSME3-interacting protein isoform X1 [Takifugu rubripes]|nr:PSME3-interacting protein isoform X1 [Takifugu rubripes]